MIEIKTLLKVLVESQSIALMLSPTTVLTPEEDTDNSSNATAKVSENVKETPLVVLEEITHAFPENNYNEQYQQPPFEHQLCDFTGNNTIMERNFKSKGDKMMSKKYVLDGYNQLYDAASDGDWEKASQFFQNDPQAIREVITEELETPLCIAVRKNHVVFIEEIVRLMPPEYGNLKAAEMMVIKNQKLTQIRNRDGRVPLAYALAYTTGAQKEIVEYLYSVTRDEDPSPFLGHDGASLLCDAIDHEFYDIASSLVHRFPGLVSTKSKWSKQYGLEILLGNPSTFLSGAKLTWWQNCMYSLIQVDIDAAHGNDSQLYDKNSLEIDEGTESDEENPSPSIMRADIEDAGNSLKSSRGIKENEDDLSDGSKVPLSTSKDSSIIKSISILFMPYLMRVPHFERLYKKKLLDKQALTMVQNMLEQLGKTMNREEIAEFFDSSTAIKMAIKHGFTEFIVATLEKFSYLICQEMGGLTMAQMAVQERNDTILNYLCETADIMGGKIRLYSKEDKSYNTLLHYAAKLAPLAKLNLVSGAALQMQRELQWFNGVESILLKNKRFRPNRNGDTAQSIFTEEHKDLVVKGEKWMKDTSGSCMLVAALIATVAFAAAFTIPGGNISDSNSSKNGTPVFLETTSFMVFAVADALALFSSITSVLMFLALYTSRYAEEEFHTSLPRKLVIGLGTLFISMATILVAFSASLSIVLEDRCVWAPIPMALFSCVPVLLFVLLQLPLFVEIVRSAYWGSLFSKHRYVQPRVDQYNGTKKNN
ncbi:hypothetical protein MKW98_027342 [Papaver atlanticum]|uniref:PGG domain-containing protein n=1 Tax=Papaver atlanticum TaxID=357466 RepID=A0AAD4T3B9_9MAGN|nr:hypothetical protein MKW98_027342 [Papaver atlanticum]